MTRVRSRRRAAIVAAAVTVALAVAAGSAWHALPGSAEPLSRGDVQTRVWQDCLVAAGWTEHHGRFDGADGRLFGADSVACVAEARLLTRPSLGELAVEYGQELRASRCLRRLGYETDPPTLGEYVGSDEQVRWNPFADVRARGVASREVSAAIDACSTTTGS